MSDPQHAYFITFVRSFHGGWFEAGELKPYWGERVVGSHLPRKLERAISKCDPYLQSDQCDLRRRLLELSLCAFKVKTESGVIMTPDSLLIIIRCFFRCTGED